VSTRDAVLCCAGGEHRGAAAVLVGRDILDRQRQADWGSKVVTSLAADLQREFPGQRGWSRSNLLYMRRAAEAWRTEDEFVQQPVGRLPWGHVTVLLDRLTTREERDWYAARTAEYGWSRAVLEHQIKADLRRAVGAAPTNFTEALEAPDSELAQQLVKDPYVFEHLALVERVAERDVEQALMDRLQDTMLELGRGMAFVGRQVRLTVPDDASDRVDEFYVEPAHVGQLGTYVAIVDDQFRRPEIHSPTIGILLCTGKTGPTVWYALASPRCAAVRRRARGRDRGRPRPHAWHAAPRGPVAGHRRRKLSIIQPRSGAVSSAPEPPRVCPGPKAHAAG
jgi:predicted nuclease of restriction endonuclease-like (RecB) superfamily